jgi:hypothetical protein
MVSTFFFGIRVRLSLGVIYCTEDLSGFLSLLLSEKFALPCEGKGVTIFLRHSPFGTKLRRTYLPYLSGYSLGKESHIINHG